MVLSRKKAQRYLAYAWASAFLVFVLVLFLQTVVFDIYRESEQVIWDWLQGSFTPTLGLMLGVLGAQAFGGGDDKTRADVPFFVSACVFSGLYLAFLGVVIVLVAARFSFAPLDAAQTPLEAVEAIVNIAIGAFFVGRYKQSAAGPATSA